MTEEQTLAQGTEDNLMEVIYRDADRKLEYLSVIAGLLGILFGYLFDELLLALIAMPTWVMLIFLIHRIPNRALKLVLNGVFFILFVAWYLVLTRGLVETRYLYFVFSFLLVFYRNIQVVVSVAITAAIFIIAMYITLYFPDWLLGDFVTGYILEEAGQTLLRINFTVLALAICCFGTIWLAESFHRRTHQSLKAEKYQLQQIKIMEKNQEIATRLADGNLEPISSDEKLDALGEALDQMRMSLEEARTRELNERYINEGLTQAAEILRHQENGLEALCDEVLQFLIGYLKANQGGIFLVESDGERRYLDMYACYAYDRKKYLRQQLGLGQGLTGQVFLEGKTTYLKAIPEHYLSIRSGLGTSSPRNLILVPMSTVDGVKGVLEIASFQLLEDHQIAFLERVANSMAGTFEVVRTNDQTRELLMETQSNAEEMRTQEEEMRQNMEELEATQEELRRKEKKYIKDMENLKGNHAIELITLKKELADARDELNRLKAGEKS